jgi:hypothetical protein
VLGGEQRGVPRSATKVEDALAGPKCSASNDDLSGRQQLGGGGLVPADAPVQGPRCVRSGPICFSLGFSRHACLPAFIDTVYHLVEADAGVFRRIW